MTTATPQKPLTSSEKRELTGLIKRRFELLKKAVKQRESEMRVSIREQMMQEKSRVTAKYSKKLDALREEGRKLEAKADKLKTEAAEEGITFGHYSYNGKFFEKGDLVAVGVVENSEVTVAGINEAVDTAMERIVTEKGRAGMALETAEIDLLEELTISQIDSEAGKAFLAKVPTVESFIIDATANAKAMLSA